MKSGIEKYLELFRSRPASERRLVIIAVLAVVAWLLFEGGAGAFPAFGTSDTEITTRVREIEELERSVSKYKRLSARLSTLERTYASSELSVEQVYAEVENLIKEVLGGEGYELRPLGTIVSISDTAEQQGYSLKLRSLTLKQLVDLLYRLEQGKAPLFLGRLEITKGSQQGYFSANLELSSIRRKRVGS